MRQTRRATARSVALATDDELWGALPPKQTRSVDAIQRIASAGRALFRARDFDAVSVADIARAAGISVGAFYTRFPSKEHLAIHLLGDLDDELRASALREMDPQRLTGVSLSGVVRRFLALTADAFLRHRGLLRPATLIARQTRDDQLRGLVRRFNKDVHGLFRARLLERLSVTDPKTTVARIDLAILWTSAALREVLLYGEPVSALSRSATRLVDELSRGFVLYLESPE
jgi:AcrR family transcriptional regulator